MTIDFCNGGIVDLCEDGQRADIRPNYSLKWEVFSSRRLVPDFQLRTSS